MLDFAKKLPRYSYYDSLSSKPVDFIMKKVFTNDMFYKNQYKFVRMPCLQLRIVDLKSCSVDKRHEFNHYMKAYN